MLASSFLVEDLLVLVSFSGLRYKVQVVHTHGNEHNFACFGRCFVSSTGTSSVVSSVATGVAYLEVMHQIMAAAQSAAQLDVAEIIRDRTADGSLPTPDPTNGISVPNTAAAAAASAAVAGSCKRKAMDSEHGGVEEAEGSQMQQAKRPKVEGGLDEQPQEADTVGVSDHPRLRSAAACDQLGQNHSRRPEPVEPKAAPLMSQPGVHGPPEVATVSARGNAAGTAEGPGQGQARIAAVDQYSTGQPGEGTSAMPDEGISQSSQAGPSSSHTQPGPSSHTELGQGTHTEAGPSSHAQAGLSSPTEAGPNTHTHTQPPGGQTEPGLSTQAGTSDPIQPGPSQGMPDQDTQEGANSEVKEKREQARSRSRAWRKVLLDGLDLQAELTAAAAAAGQPDSDLAAAETKVGSLFCWCQLWLACRVSS